MDQGNSGPNNQNPNNPSSFGMDSPTSPVAPQASNFDQPGTFSQPMSPPVANPTAPPTFMADNTFGAAPIPIPEQPATLAAPTSDLSLNPLPPSDIQSPPNTMGSAEANPLGVPAPQADQNLAMTPTAFNPFSSPATGSTPPPSTPTPLPSSETAPTDLSNLVNNSPEAISYMPQTDAVANTNGIQPESLVVTPSPSSGNEVTQAVSSSGSSGGFPKILIIIGGIILIGAIAASAYFILGVGKPAESVPVPVPEPTSAPIVTVTPIPEAPISTQSGSFSNLPGNPATVSATPAAGGTAYDRLLKIRQSASASATPKP